MASNSQRKTVLITGCSSGIGEALAREFQAQGYHVIATARKIEAISHLQKAGMTTLSLDVTKPESVTAIKTEVEKLNDGKLDVLVNNAGILTRGALADVSREHIFSIFNTNLFGLMAVVSSLLPLLIAAKGTIVNISSASSVTPFPFKGPYAMTKAALNSYGRTLAIELSPFDVRVLTCPTGYIESKLEANGTDQVPENSLYKAMAGKMELGVPQKQMEGAEYAKVVVNEVEKGRGWGLGPLRFGAMREWLWVGTGASKGYWASMMGESFLQRGFKDIIGWNEITRVVRKDNGLE
ncbi:short chain dehydrogenase domain-containing protein [Trichoderma breve]|uniref:Short chain dehydrogenase domain-containing protein n=1 Tax=Trichoderma breve TaxID=2034170 RepID=A0A9W9B5K0_9HYPO|nr:short chain dehydrogenase domain-containing protein [Trichoderma breve]KAJ4856825.1 short chain dehydrogenase domain-containing protein [Trichoderma breve]